MTFCRPLSSEALDALPPELRMFSLLKAWFAGDVTLEPSGHVDA